MSKRKINVEKLTDEQLQMAQDKIFEIINKYINELNNKWAGELAKYGKKCVVEAAVDTEDAITQAKQQAPEPKAKESADFCDDKLNAIASDLDRIAKGMQADIDLASTKCNQLLNRYGMACLFGFSTEPLPENK